MTKKQRADAVANREHVLEVARKVFATDGLGVPIDEIAKRSGVGIGTVYRHFPTKQALIVAIMTAHTTQLADRAAELADADDPEAAFFELLDLVVQMVSKKKDLGDALAGVDIVAITAKPRLALRAAFQKLLGRAQKAGAIRPELEIDDVLALVTSCAPSPLRPTGSPTRLLEVIRDGLRVPKRRA